MLPQFVLASASPARRRLLESVGIQSIVRPSHFDESQVQTTHPDKLVQTLALRKAEVVAEQLKQEGVRSPTLVLGCDSVLAIHDEIHGKPANPTEAIVRWQQMRGQIGKLYTGHALISLANSEGNHDQTLVLCQMTQVHFAWVTDRQIEAYVATGEPLNCAGCFALEGKGGSFVERLEGCHSNVIGLSLPLLRRMLEQLKYDLTDFW